MRLGPCTVTIVTLDPRTGSVLSTIVQKSSAIAFCIDESNKKCLVVGAEERSAREYRVAGGVKMHTRFINDGKATLSLVHRNINLMVSNADPRALKEWTQTLMSGRPPAPTASSPPRPGSSASTSTAAPNVSAPPKRHLAPSTPSRANKDSTSPGQQLAPRSKGKMGRAPGCSPAWSASPSNAAGRKLSPTATANLTTEQQEVMREVVLGGQSVFFTGGAGVGKSHLLRQMVSRLDSRTTYITASTGLAACAIGGVTLHHWSGIGGSIDRPLNEIVEGARRKRGAQWRAATTLVIDEISMLDGDVFDLLEEVARRVRGDTRPFGGLQLIICGDFFQLPPVAKGGASFKFAFEAKTWQACVPLTFELTKVFRQTDERLVDALNQIRLGSAPPDVRALIRPCEGKRLDAEDGISATRLFTHKADCAKLNDAELRALSGTQLTFSARDDGRDADALATLRSSCPVPSELTLKVGAQVILMKTLDADAGLVNGARGVVTKFLATRNPSVRFNNGVERTMRLEAFGLSQAGAVVASRMQLPLALGWAISVHKSQGMTLDRCELSLRNVFECGQMYVALSRCRSLEGLALRDVDWSKCRAHPKVLAWHREQQLKRQAAIVG